jgi:hypothetical protein
MVGSGPAQANPFDQRFTRISGTALSDRPASDTAATAVRARCQPVMATGASHASRSTVMVWPPRVSLLLTMYWWARL